MSDFLQFEEGEGVNRLEQREYRQGLMADPSASYDLGSRRGSFADDDDAEANARAQRPDTQYPNEQYRYAHEDPAFWNAPRFKPQHGTKTDTNFHTNPVYDRFGIDEVDSRYVDHENEEFKPRFWQDTGGGDSARLGYDTSELLQASDESELSDPTPFLARSGDDPLDKNGGIEDHVRELLEPKTTKGIAAKATADSRRAAIKRAAPAKKAAPAMKSSAAQQSATKAPLIWGTPPGRKAAPPPPKKKGFWAKLFGR